MASRYTAEEVAEAIKKGQGFISVVAKSLNCSETSVRNYIQRYESCKRALLEAREAMKDFAEGKLFQKIRDGDTASIIFFLKTQAKDRGYIERQEVAGADGKELIIKVEYADD